MLEDKSKKPKWTLRFFWGAVLIGFRNLDFSGLL